MAPEICKNCGKEVKMTVQRGSGYCSQNCEDQGPNGPRKHRNTDRSPKPQRSTQMFYNG